MHLAGNLYHLFNRPRPASDADFSDRIGNTDPLALEGVPQRQHHLALDAVEAVRIGQPDDASILERTAALPAQASPAAVRIGPSCR
jgi:hypothetical protein